MKYLAAILLSVSAPAFAQHQHQEYPIDAPADPHAHHMMENAPDPHAGNETSMTSAPPDPHSAHAQPDVPSSPPADAHADHATSGPDHDAHTAAGHAPGIPDPPIASPSPQALSGPMHAADTIFDPQAMASAREVVRKEHGDIKSSMFLIDQLEVTVGEGKDGYAWNAQGSFGGDIDRLWVKTEGVSSFGESPEHAEMQALWSHALDPWWNLQTGIRQDIGAGPDRTYAVLGVQGLAPYWFELDGAVFLSDKGDVTARIEAEYDQRLTRSMILQPRVELNFAVQDVPELGIGSGLSDAELGLRLRYQFIPEFAPYVGVGYERAFGDTADFRRARGDKVAAWRFLIGIRSWF